MREHATFEDVSVFAFTASRFYDVVEVTPLGFADYEGWNFFWPDGTQIRVYDDEPGLAHVFRGGITAEHKKDLLTYGIRVEKQDIVNAEF